VTSAQEKQQNAHSRASSLRLSAVLSKVKPGDCISEKIRVLAAPLTVQKKNVQSYCVVGVDGSQVYPDRSFASGVCGIINIGGLVLTYGEHSSTAEFFSASTLVSKADMQTGLVFCPEVIDTLRTLRELEAGLQKMRELTHSKKVLLLDGSMIPYGLMLKNTAVQQFFATRFLSLLQECYDEQVIVAWYISAPQSQLLARAIGEDEQTDAQLLDGFLQDGQTTPFFTLNQSTLFGVSCGSQHATSFFYVQNGTEIIRIECPAWMLDLQTSQEFLCSVVADQVEKGFGYPVALTEAHRQALITEKDRDFVLLELERQGFVLPGGALKATRKQIIPA